jgi:hypothetical protein
MILTVDAIKKKSLEWDKKEQFYRYPSGRKVSDRAMYQMMQRDIKSMKSNQGWATDQLIAGKMTFEDWQKFNIDLIRRHHVTMMRFSKGGKQYTTANDYLQVARELKQIQYPKFQKFAQDIKDGKQTEAQLRNRLGMYADSSKVSFERGKLGRSHSQFGRRLLGGCANHCQDCIDYASLGWLPVGQVTPPGVNCVCGPNCCCSVELSDRLPSILNS